MRWNFNAKVIKFQYSILILSFFQKVGKLVGGTKYVCGWENEMKRWLLFSDKSLNDNQKSIIMVLSIDSRLSIEDINNPVLA